jgi:hypothetical protein
MGGQREGERGGTGGAGGIGLAGDDGAVAVGQAARRERPSALELAVAVATTAAPSTVKWTTAPASASRLRAGFEVILSVGEAPVSLTSFSVSTGAGAAWLAGWAASAC